MSRGDGKQSRSQILHLGLGSFHRAHQAAYLQELLDRGDRCWSLASGNIRPGMEDVIDALAAQRGGYTLETVTPAGERSYRRIQSIKHVLPWQADLHPLIRIGGEASTRIVSFTVTEAGYYLDSSGNLETSSPEIRADLEAVRAGGAGTTLYGALVPVLRARLRRAAGPVTLLCCDNLRHNGARSRAGLLQFIEKLPDPELLAWAERDTMSPNSMVDRITPRPNAALRERVRAATGVLDAAPVMSEYFAQWVIEDRFCGCRPAWELVGVQIVPSVEPYEEAKIRILNASHSVIAWAGALLGFTFVHEAARDARVRRWIHEYTDDAIECLRPSPVDLEDYRSATIERFGNAALGDTLQRVAQDSYAKLKGFVVPTLCERLRKAQPIEGAGLVPALFLAFLQHWRRDGLGWTYQDGALSTDAARALTESRDPLAMLCEDAALWGDCAGHPRLSFELRRAQRRLLALLGTSSV